MTASAEMQARDLGGHDREMLPSGGLPGGGGVEQAPEINSFFSPPSLPTFHPFPWAGGLPG